MNKLLLTAAGLTVLCISTSTVHAQYPGGYGGVAGYGGFGGYGRGYGGVGPARARLSPYLNLTNGGDPAVNYHLGVVPERERRYNETLFGGRLRQLELQQDTLEARRGGVLGGDEVISPVPIAGQPIGSRTSASYFRQDAILRGTHRSARFR